MHGTAKVDQKARKPGRKVVSAKYPVDRLKLLEAVQARRGDQHLSDTISQALDDLIERHFPGTVRGGLVGPSK